MDGNLQLTNDEETGDLLYDEEVEGARPVASEGEHFKNLADGVIPERVVDALSSTLTELIAFDQGNRAEWEDLNAENFKLLGVGPESEADDEDMGYADTSDHPLLLTALTRFQSKALSAMLPSDDMMVRTKSAMDLDSIEDPDEREEMHVAVEEAGLRVQRFYTDYLQNRVQSYEEDTDQILYNCGLMGMGLRKIVKDPKNRRVPVDPIEVSPADLIISYNTKNFRSGRYSHRIHQSVPELIRKIRNGTYRAVEGLTDGDIEAKDPVTEERDRIVGLSSAYMKGTESHLLYEAYCELFLEDDPHPDGLARPYVVTIHQRTREILRIVRNWEPGDEAETPIEHFVVYPFHPGKSSVYTLGLGHILANVTRALRTAQRRGFEAGYLQNHPSGFKLSSLSIRDEATKIRSGEFVDVDSPTNDIRSALMLHPFQGPSQGLMALAERLEANGKELGGIASIDFATLMKAGIAAGPAMAAYEESSEFQTAVHRRLYKAHRTELNLIHARMREVYGNKPVVYGSGESLRPGDLMLVDLLPYMKPGQVSKQKSILEAQAIWELSGDAPDVIDRRKAAVEYLRALGKANLDDIMIPDPEDDPPEPRDPISEYGMALAGQPIVAGLSQNHQAHIDTHATQMRMLQSSQLPLEKGDAAAAVLSAHIAEHMGMQMVVEVASRVGFDPSLLLNGMPPEMEAQIAPAIAGAIAEIEAERAAAMNPQSNEKVRVEEIKAQKDLTLLERKQAHEKELQAQKDKAAMERELADNEAAIDVAMLRNTQRSNATAGATASTGAGGDAGAVSSAGSGAK